MQSMQLTDWLVVIFIVAIVVVLVDGVRRKFAERRGRVVVKLDRNIPRDFDLEDLPNSELPNGGARTLVREQVPSLHTLKARRKPALKSLRPADDATARAVPVLLDTVDVEEDRIEHTNVFADPHAGESFQADDFAAADAAPAVDRAQRGSADDSDDLPDDLNEEYEEDTMLAEPTVARREPGYMETRYQGRDDDDDFDDEDFDDEEEEEDEEEDDEDFDEFDDLDDADELDDDDDDDFEDDDEDDDYDDDEDDEDDEDDDDLEEDEDLDELEGLPEDDWGSDEEQDRLVDDYENEPMPLQGALDKAASSFKRPPRQEAPRIEPGFGAADKLDDISFSEDFSAAWDDVVLDAAEAITPRPVAAAPEARAAAPKRDQGELFAAEREQPQEVIVINVMARPGQSLQGAELLQVLQGQGLRLGDMSIFHRHADSQGSGPVMFSMANMVKPGTFDLATMDTFVTPGVSFFLQMPNRVGNMACFDKMLAAAAAVREAFDAELKDEQRSVFTRQTVEHCRQRVRDFELKLLSRK